jgi:hypothetical protein
LCRLHLFLVVVLTQEFNAANTSQGGTSMETVTGIFTSRADARRAVQQLQAAGIANDRIAFLTPDTSGKEVEKEVAVSDTEQSGMGKAMGGAVGGALGTASGAGLGAGVASLLVPGVGPVLAAGLVGAAILGIGGATTGMAAGAALERGLADGVPHDELYLYEDALRNGRSVVIAFAENEEAETQARTVLNETGAQSIDAARDDWWIGLRDTEAHTYEAAGRNFSEDEADYRRGFEAAHHAKLRGRSYGEAAPELIVFYHEARSNAAFRRGYDRGLAHYQAIQDKYKT